MKEVLIEHKENCLIINYKESVKLRSASGKFKNYFKQLAATFKIIADSECILKKAKSNNNKKMFRILKNIKIMFLTFLLTKLYVLMINLENQLLFTEEKMQSINLLKQLLKNMIIAIM